MNANNMMKLKVRVDTPLRFGIAFLLRLYLRDTTSYFLSRAINSVFHCQKTPIAASVRMFQQNLRPVISVIAEVLQQVVKGRDTRPITGRWWIKIGKIRSPTTKSKSNLVVKNFVAIKDKV